MDGAAETLRVPAVPFQQPERWAPPGFGWILGPGGGPHQAAFPEKCGHGYTQREHHAFVRPSKSESVWRAVGKQQ